MEETLRDALRQGRRQLAAKNEMNKRNPVCDVSVLCHKFLGKRQTTLLLFFEAGLKASNNESVLNELHP